MGRAPQAEHLRAVAIASEVRFGPYQEQQTGPVPTRIPAETRRARRKLWCRSQDWLNRPWFQTLTTSGSPKQNARRRFCS